MWTGGVRTEAVGNRVGLALHLRAAIVAGASDCEATGFHRNFLHGLLSATPRGSPEQVGAVQQMDELRKILEARSQTQFIVRHGATRRTSSPDRDG